MKLRRFGIILVAVLAMFACEQETPGGGGITEGTYLFMTDTYTGNVYLYDIENENAEDTSFFNVGTVSPGEIYFNNDIGYITVGDNGSNLPGLYYFDPMAAVPVTTRIGDAISAQAVAFYSDTKAYVISADAGSTAGVYTFNPQELTAGLTGPISGTESLYPQDVVLGTDGNIYVSDNSNGQVITIDPANDTLGTTYSMNSLYTTGLVAAVHDGHDAIFAASTGTIDEINCTTGNVTQICDTGGVYIDYDSVNSVIYTAGWSNSYYVDVSGAGPYTAVEIGSSIGGSDVDIYDGLVYISHCESSTPYSSRLYIFDTAAQAITDNSPVSVMDQDNEGIAGLAVYEY